MSEAIGFGIFMFWLALGGWAFARIDHGKTVLAGLIWCIVLAPFAFGIALAQPRAPQPKEGKTE